MDKNFFMELRSSFLKMVFIPSSADAAECFISSAPAGGKDQIK